MRIIIATVVIVIALFAASCSSKQSFYSEVPYRSMQGKIVQVTETTYPATKSGKSIMLDKKSTQSFTYTYNNEGQLLTSAYTGKGTAETTPNTSSAFTYSKGNLVKRVTTLAPQKGKSTTHTYQRIEHSKDKDVFVQYSNSNQSADTIVANYNYAKQLVTENRKDKSGKVTKSITTFANYRKQQTEQYTNEKLDYSKTFRYNDKVLLTNEISKWGKNNEDNIKTKHTKYDSHNNWIECEIYVNNVLQSVTQRQIVYK